MRFCVVPAMGFIVPFSGRRFVSSSGNFAKLHVAPMVRCAHWFVWIQISAAGGAFLRARRLSTFKTPHHKILV
jgi:hypothetical protein